MTTVEAVARACREATDIDVLVMTMRAQRMMDGDDYINGTHAEGGAGSSGGNSSSSVGKWGDKRIFTTGEAAEVCKVSQQTIIRCFDAGRLGGFRVPGSKFRRIPRADLIRFMKDNEIPTDILEASVSDHSMTSTLDSSGSRRVLIVDDDKQILEMFQDLLARETNMQVQFASTGYDAGLLTASFRPHLIILDYMLPDINGNIVCKRLRERPELRSTKVLFVSGVVSPDEIAGLKQAGGDDFLPKPFDIHELRRRMTRLLPAE
jgi:two-component system, OmpR family, response regulator